MEKIKQCYYNKGNFTYRYAKSTNNGVLFSSWSGYLTSDVNVSFNTSGSNIIKVESIDENNNICTKCNSRNKF
ncbi:MAG: hypothetical protein ACK5HL_04670 [Bacilli bacterium]